MLTPEVPAELAGDQESAESMIRARGVRVTASRVAVLRAVNELPHADADTLTQAVRNRLGAVSTQAVYDALALFKQLGLVRRIEPAGSPARFETRVGDNHHHVTCRQCGTIADVECPSGEPPCLTPPDTQDFLIDEAEVIYWGRCADCQQQPV